MREINIPLVRGCDANPPNNHNNPTKPLSGTPDPTPNPTPLAADRGQAETTPIQWQSTIKKQTSTQNAKGDSSALESSHPCPSACICPNPMMQCIVYSASGALQPRVFRWLVSRKQRGLSLLKKNVSRTTRASITKARGKSMPTNEKSKSSACAKRR